MKEILTRGLRQKGATLETYQSFAGGTPNSLSKNSETLGFDPSRLPFLRGPIPPEKGKPSNLSIQGFFLCEFVLVQIQGLDLSMFLIFSGKMPRVNSGGSTWADSPDKGKFPLTNGSSRISRPRDSYYVNSCYMNRAYLISPLAPLRPPPSPRCRYKLVRTSFTSLQSVYKCVHM